MKLNDIKKYIFILVISLVACGSVVIDQGDSSSGAGGYSEFDAGEINTKDVNIDTEEEAVCSNTFSTSLGKTICCSLTEKYCATNEICCETKDVNCFANFQMGVCCPSIYNCQPKKE